MRYVSTRGAWRADPQPFYADPARGPGAGRRPGGAAGVSAGHAAKTSRPGGTSTIASSQQPCSTRFIDDIPPAELRQIVDATYTRECSATRPSRRC